MDHYDDALLELYDLKVCVLGPFEVFDEIRDYEELKYFKLSNVFWLCLIMPYVWLCGQLVSVVRASL